MTTTAARDKIIDARSVHSSSFQLPAAILMPFGLLNVDKPLGMTSRRVVDRLQRFVRPAKIGHAGTLDPLATGVLVVAVGPATRLTRHVQSRPKTYRARFLLGRRSDTDDVTGQLVKVANMQVVSRQRLEAALARLLGCIEQVPPAFSAVHVDGQRAYRRARRGEDVAIVPRPVTVHRIELLAFEFPELALEIECSSGTYIRAVGRDLDQALGCGVVLTRLVRTRVGPFELDAAVSLEEVTEETHAACLLPAAAAVEHLPRHLCTAAELVEVSHGRPIAGDLNQTPADGGDVSLLAPDGTLAAVAGFDAAAGRLTPRQVFIEPSEVARLEAARAQWPRG